MSEQFEIKPKVFTGKEWQDVWEQAQREDRPPENDYTIRKWKFPWKKREIEILPGTRSNVALIKVDGTARCAVPFETDDDETTRTVLDRICTWLCHLKKKYPDLTWNASEGHFRTRWTRFQMIGQK